jgi:hypothetical protein
LGAFKNASALDWMNGPIRDIYYLGVSNENRMVIAYRGMGNVYIQGRSLREYGDSNWMGKNRKYGDYQCSYAEFPVISFPATIKIIGNTLPHSGGWAGTVRKPAVETWAYVRIGANGAPTYQKMWSNKSWY